MKNQSKSSFRAMLVDISYGYSHEEDFQQDSVSTETTLEDKCKIWVLDWDKRLFRKKLNISEQVTACLTPTQHNLITERLENYHKTCPDQVGLDRFVWTSLACALINQHQKHDFIASNDRDCSLHDHRCLLVLLQTGFYLKIHSELVSRILDEILVCTGDLRFFFSFLPGISLSLYIFLLWNNPFGFEKELCEEYFSLLESRHKAFRWSSSAYFYEVTQPFLYYLLQHLRPLPRVHVKVRLTIQDIVNAPILPGRKYSMLTLAMQFFDKDTVTYLLQIGASAQVFYWDQDVKRMITAERMMVTMVNSHMVSRQFLINVDPLLLKQSDIMIANISSFSRVLLRSVLNSELKKADDLWSDECTPVELNREISDLWDIGSKKHVPSLLHICRINIREEILKTDKVLLPMALESLPLPRKLVVYLNLLLD